MTTQSAWRSWYCDSLSWICRSSPRIVSIQDSTHCTSYILIWIIARYTYYVTIFIIYCWHLLSFYRLSIWITKYFSPSILCCHIISHYSWWSQICSSILIPFKQKIIFIGLFIICNWICDIVIAITVII